MEFHITLADRGFDPQAIENALGAVDPSVLVDVDPTGQIARVATWIDLAQLIRRIAATGYPVTAEQIVERPSVCCGGCSG